MKRHSSRARRIAAVAAVGAALAVSLAWAAGGSEPAHTHAHTHGGSAAAGFQRDMDESMARMMESMHAPGYTGNADADFLAMMIAHHAGAVDMARLVLQHGRDPATRQLAEEIIASQTIEIDGMRRRLAMLREGAAEGRPEFPALGGTRGP